MLQRAKVLRRDSLEVVYSGGSGGNAAARFPTIQRLIYLSLIVGPVRVWGLCDDRWCPRTQPQRAHRDVRAGGAEGVSNRVSSRFGSIDGITRLDWK